MPIAADPLAPRSASSAKRGARNHLQLMALTCVNHRDVEAVGRAVRFPRAFFCAASHDSDSLVQSAVADAANLHLSDARASARAVCLSWWEAWPWRECWGSFCRRSQMQHHQPIIKSEYVAAIVHIATAMGLLAIIAVLLFAMP